MRKLSVKWVPKCLNADQKHQQCQSSEQLLEFFQRDPNDFLLRLVTIDETWLYRYDPKTKQQSIAAHPAPKNSECKNPLEKFLPRFFGIIDYIPKCQTINAGYYSSLLVQLKENCCGKVTKGGFVLARQCPSSLGSCNPEETGLSGLPVS